MHAQQLSYIYISIFYFQSTSLIYRTFIFTEHVNPFPQHLLHIVAMILTMVQDDDVTTIDAIEMVDVEDVEVERVVAMSTSLETQVVTPCLTSSYASDKYIILF
jgi:hypothetical protein